MQELIIDGSLYSVKNQLIIWNKIPVGLHIREAKSLAVFNKELRIGSNLLWSETDVVPNLEV